MKKYVQHLWHALCPVYCHLCHVPMQDGTLICADCALDLPGHFSVCYQCAMPLPIGVKSARYCGSCLGQSLPFQRSVAPWSYQPPMDKWIMQLKFQRKILNARLLGELLAGALSSQYEKQDWPDLLVPVPLHRSRLRQRGFNQALEIAKPLSRKLGIALDYQSVLRHKATQAQSSLSAKKREENVKGAFRLKNSLSVSHVAIIDDVMTTGHTMIALGRCLAKSGVKRIDCWCVARAY